MLIKKTNVAFPLTIDTHPDRVIANPNDISVKYLKAGSGNAEVEFTQDIVPMAQKGTYSTMPVINEAGYYHLFITIPADDKFVEENYSIPVYVSDSTLDDIYQAISASDSKIDEIKRQVDVLDEEAINGVKDAVASIDTQLKALAELTNDESNDAIVSLRELLKELQTSTDNNKSLLTSIQTFVTAATDDIENMIKGSDKLADGTDNPFKGNTNIDIMQKLTSINTYIGTQVANLASTLSSKMDDVKDSLSVELSAIKVTVDTNKSHLTHEVHGLSKMMEKLGEIDSFIRQGNVNVVTGINEIKSELSTINTGIHTKLDSIEGKTDQIIASMASSSRSRVTA